MKPDKKHVSPPLFPPDLYPDPLSRYKGDFLTPGFVDRALTGDLPDWDLPDKLPATDVRPPREDINEARSKIKGFNPDIPLM